jgi:hypothetical protein
MKKIAVRAHADNADFIEGADTEGLLWARVHPSRRSTMLVQDVA